MKFLKYLIYSILSLTSAHDFTICSESTILNISSLTLNPDPPKSGENLEIGIKGNLSKDIINPDTTLNLYLDNLKILSENIDLCKLTTCPIYYTQPVNIVINQNIPSLIPKNIEIEIQLESKQKNEEITCIKTSFIINKLC